jgi:hypothetical protein
MSDLYESVCVHVRALTCVGARMCARAYTCLWMRADAGLSCFIFLKVFVTWESLVHGCSSFATHF